MKRLAVLIVVVVALAVAAIASAVGGTGTTSKPSSFVQILNMQTGARGSTYSTAGGYYTFNGLNYNYTYEFHAETCIAGWHFSSSWTNPWPGGSALPYLYEPAVGNC